MSQLKEWMYGGKISKLVVVITSKETGEHVERWQFDVRIDCLQLQSDSDCPTGTNLRKICQVQVVQGNHRSGELNARVCIQY